MKRVFIAGSYSADSTIKCLKNIGNGERWTDYAFFEGMSPYNPFSDRERIIRNPNRNYGVKQFQKATMKWLEVSEEVWVIPNSEKSKGVKAELEKASELGIPIFDIIVEQLHDHCGGGEITKLKLRDCKHENLETFHENAPMVCSDCGEYMQ